MHINVHVYANECHVLFELIMELDLYDDIVDTDVYDIRFMTKTLGFYSLEFTNKDWPTMYPLYIDARTLPPTIIWIIYGGLTVRCSMSMTWFPFDRQLCIVEIAAASSPSHSIYLDTDPSCLNTSMLINSGEFTMALTKCYVKVMKSQFSVRNYIM